MKMMNLNQNWLFHFFYFLNMEYSLTVMNTHIQLKEFLYNILLERNLDQIFNLGSGYIFIIKNINNSEKIILKNLYKNNQDLYQTFGTFFPKEDHEEQFLTIWHRLMQYQQLRNCYSKM